MQQRNNTTDRTSGSGVDTGRRRFLLGAGAAAGALGAAGAFGLRSIARADGLSGSAGAARTPVDTGPVTIVIFNDQGEKLGEKIRPPVIKTAAEWKQQLSPASYHVAREGGTEPPFSGRYVHKPDSPGFYRCICCGNALYDAGTQFHSGTGWPSFWQPIAAENVTEHVDNRLLVTRTGIACTLCNAHLGHKFHDGPPPTGLRYCMNSVALTFIATQGA